MNIRKTITGGALVAGALALAIPASAGPNTVYDSVPSPLPASLPSIGYQATQTAEAGDLIALAGGATTLDSMTVGMVSWACESGAWNTGDCETTPGTTFDHPVTVKLYDPVDIDTPIAAVTQTVAVPFRPSADEECGDNGGDDRRWLSDDGCTYGYLFEIEFDLDRVEVPAQVIASVAFDTQSYGEAPIGAPGPYNALNLGLVAAAPSTGTNVDPDSIYIDSPYYDSPNGFGLSDYYGEGWGGYTPAISLNTASVPVTVEKCNANFADLGFKNVGQCVASVTASKG